MAETVDIPKVGPLPKKALIPVGVAVAAFVGWRFWVARQDAATADSPIADGEFGAVDTSIPGVVGAVSATNSYGSNTGSDTGSDSTDGRNLTTNAAWTTYARSQMSGSYDDADILAALGNYLGSRPLSSGQETIVRAAVAVAGYPPVGTFAIIPGGNTPLQVAPSGLRAITIRADHITLGWNGVAGASGYRLYGAGQSVKVDGTQGTISALAAGTSYGFTVAALSGAGTEGPRSGTVNVKTSAASSPSTPAKPGVVGGKPTGSRGYGWAQVRKGDSLKSFASSHGITLATLRKYNSASTLNRLSVGEWLRTRADSNPTSGYRG